MYELFKHPKARLFTENRQHKRKVRLYTGQNLMELRQQVAMILNLPDNKFESAIYATYQNSEAVLLSKQSVFNSFME